MNILLTDWTRVCIYVFTFKTTASPLCWVLTGEETTTIFIVFDFIQSGLEHTIYRTRGDHANHHKTDAVLSKLKS
jgi:hypothetical protein